MADIEVVIKITEGDYKFIKETAEKEPSNLNYIARKILTGTVLPKGHGRLKDIDWIDDNCENHYSDTDGSWCYRWKDIDNAPTILEADKESEG